MRVVQGLLRTPRARGAATRERLLDAGTGSGILSVGAALLGARAMHDHRQRVNRFRVDENAEAHEVGLRRAGLHGYSHPRRQHGG